MSISSNFLISQLRPWFWSLGSLDSGLPPPRVPPHMPPHPAPNAPARTLTVAPREPWGSPEAPRLQVSEGPGWVPAVSGRVEGLRRAEGGSPPEAVVSFGVARQRILGIRGKTCLWVRDPYSATPTALPGSPERTTVPSVSRSGHPLSVLPHSPPHPVSPISSEAWAPLPLTACACPPVPAAALLPTGVASSLGTSSRNSFPRNTSH